MDKHFINLTNGLEWAAELPDFSLIRIESTAIEKDDWDRVMRDLDANFLMSLALGHTCHVYDCGTRREISKTISVGLPYIRDRLKATWLDRKEGEARTDAEKATKRKLKYFQRYVATDEIRLIGHSRATVSDGDKPFYRDLAVRWLQ